MGYRNGNMDSTRQDEKCSAGSWPGDVIRSICQKNNTKQREIGLSAGCLTPEAIRWFFLAGVGDSMGDETN